MTSHSFEPLGHLERVALEMMHKGEWVRPALLHPATEITLDEMAAKGWIEKDGLNDVYRITAEGHSALVRLSD